MKTLFRTSFLLLLMPLFCATQCEEDFSPAYEEPVSSVTISSADNLMVNDTLWLTSRRSSMLYNPEAGDSTMNQNAFAQDIVSVLRLQSGGNRSNTTEALVDFTLVPRIGRTDLLGACPESDALLKAPLTDDERFYVYQIGLIAQNSGDFVLVWQDPVDLRQIKRNLQILQRYPMSLTDDDLGVTRCGVTSAIPDVNERQGEFFFTVN